MLLLPGPKDDQEEANRIVTLVQNGLMPRRTGMMELGIQNPSEEMAALQVEWTNAILEPQRTMTQMQNIQMARTLGFANTQQANTQGPASINIDQNAQMAANAAPPGGQSANVPAAPNAQGLPENALGPNGAPLPPGTMTAQTMMQNGKTTGRVLTQNQIPLGNG